MSDQRTLQYRAFVQASPPRDDGYLFASPECRFLPEPNDELFAPPGARALATPGGPCIELGDGARLLLPELELETLKRLLAALPCRYSQLLIELGPRAPSLMERCFSRVLFAPAALAELEQQLPSLELVRFPGSPYELVRAYWRNMIAVRQRLEDAPLPGSASELRALLSELHRLLLLGAGTNAERSSFYLPASSLARKRPTPGELYEVESTSERRGSELILTGGARVSVPLLGGAHYWQLLAESVSDEGALATERQLTLLGLDLGRVVLARAQAEDESERRPWFLPPRPLRSEHFELLLAALSRAYAAAGAGERDAAVQALAAFHHGFVRIHPLPSGNQSLAMSFVNAALARLLGVGIPHLLLDQLALRFELSAYQRLFARAVSAWCVPFDNSAHRLRQLLRMRVELNELVSELGAAASLLEARALLPQRPHARLLALLADAPQA